MADLVRSRLKQITKTKYVTEPKPGLLKVNDQFWEMTIIETLTSTSRPPS